MRLILTTIFAATVALAAISPARADNVDAYVNAQMQQQKIPGLSLAVVRDGKVLLARGYGRADVRRRVPATPQTVYEIGSITKQFTAAAIMMLVEQGKIGLDEHIRSYLPNLPDAWKAITVRNLLTQTSGLKDYLDTPDSARQAQHDAAHDDIIRRIIKAPLAFPPGEQWAYSNTNYFLLGMILERVTGQTYGAFLKERIFGPLGMGATRVNDLSAPISHRASGYTPDGATLRRADTISMSWPFSAGVLVSTVNDMATWDAALAGGKVLAPADLQQMWTAATLKNGTATNYGFGWVIDDVNGHRHIWHNGGIPGFAADIARFPDDKLTVIVLTNTDQARPEAIAQGIAGLVLPALAPPTPIQDKDPQTTRRLREVLVGLRSGAANLNAFTPEMLAVLRPQLTQQSAALTSFGPLKSFQPIAQKTNGPLRVYDYQAVFGLTPLLFHFSLTQDGRIAGVRYQRD